MTDDQVKAAAASSPTPMPAPHFVVTGFGPFRGVSDNPTTTIVKALPSYLSDLASKNDVCGPPGTNAAQQLASNTTTHVFETSAEDVRKSVKELFDRLSADDTDSSYKGRDVVLLHIGVNYMGTCFQVERAAFNDASFRVPDERGYQPKGECILVEDEEGCTCESSKRQTPVPSYGEKLWTTLKVPSLVQKMSERGYGNNVKVSGDPGRFVCNYVYCYSLDKSNEYNETAAVAQSSDDANISCKTRAHSLFLHVPPFKTVDFKKQMEFVVGLMDEISIQLAKTRTKRRR